MSNGDIFVDIMIPLEAIDDNEFKSFMDEMESFNRQSIDEMLKFRLNYIVHGFEHYLKDNYPDSKNIKCRVKGDMAYFETEWTVERLCEVHEKYCPEKHNDKPEYTRIEINNMLFDLELEDVLGGYEQVAVPLDSTYNDNIYNGTITVLSRYFVDDLEIEMTLDKKIIDKLVKGNGQG